MLSLLAQGREIEIFMANPRGQVADSASPQAKITIQDDAVRCIQRGIEKASSAQIEGSRDEARAIIFNIPIMIHTSAARLATGPATSDARARARTPAGFLRRDGHQQLGHVADSVVLPGIGPV